MTRKGARRVSFPILSLLVYLSCLVSCSDGLGTARLGPGSADAKQNGTVLVYEGNRVESLNVTTGTLNSIVTANSGGEAGSPGMASFSPDASKITFKEQAGRGEDSLVIYNFTEKTQRVLLKMPYLDGPRWSPDGRTIAFSGRLGNSGAYSLYVYALDIGKLSATIEGQLKDGEMVFSWAPDAKSIAYQDPTNNIYVFDLAKREGTRIDGGWFPTWSPSGRYIAYRSDGSGDPGYIIYDRQTRTKEQILRGVSAYRSLIWSPDSRYLIYAADGRGEFYGDLFVLDLGTKKAARVLHLEQSVYPTDWVPRPVERP
jgi:Tol biopolymer transport system component